MSASPHILVLAGGVGGGKFVRGLVDVLPPGQMTVVVNTADDFVHLGLHICPDIDSVLYAMADMNDPRRGWGLKDETWNFMDALERLGGETWFRLGDRDLATHTLRTRELAGGKTLSQVTALLARRFGIEHAVVPMSDATVRTIVDTDEGPLAFQDYFVQRRCEPKFRGVTFQGADTAGPSAAFKSALERADAIIITPSNPFVSIDPIRAVRGVEEALARFWKPVVAVSPIVGGQAVKGPLCKMLRERGADPSPLAIAEHYGRLVTHWVIDKADEAHRPAIAKLDRVVQVTDTVMRTLDDQRRLARDAVELALQPVAELAG